MRSLKGTRIRAAPAGGAGGVGLPVWDGSGRAATGPKFLGHGVNWAVNLELKTRRNDE